MVGGAVLGLIARRSGRPPARRRRRGGARSWIGGADGEPGAGLARCARWRVLRGVAQRGRVACAFRYWISDGAIPASSSTACMRGRHHPRRRRRGQWGRRHSCQAASSAKDRRAAPRRMRDLLSTRIGSSPTRAVAADVQGGWRARVVVALRQRPHAANPATPSGVMAASAPPQISRRVAGADQRDASPMACAPVLRGGAAEFGPFAPSRTETSPRRG